MKKNKWVMFGFVAVIVGILFTWSQIRAESTKLPGSKKKKVPVVATQKVSRGSVSRTLYMTGEATPVRLASLASPAEGPVKGLRVREGDRVKAGDSLLSIGRKKGAEALVASLRENLRKEEEDLKRIRQLVNQDALPGEQLDEAKANYEHARSEFIKATENMGDYSITAPWDGIVSSVKVRDGHFVTPRSILIEMYDPSDMVIRTSIPEKDSAVIHKGLSVSVKLDAYPGVTFRGTIIRVYPYLQPETRTRTFEIKLVKPVKLLPGMFARIALDAEKAENVLIIPLHALTKTKTGETAVFVVQNGKARTRKITTGLKGAETVQVLTGLHEGDSVVVEGQEKLKDNAAVKAVSASPLARQGEGKSPRQSTDREL